MQITQSKQLFSRAQQRIPGGVNSPVRAFKSVNMTPLFITRAQGSKLYDADGNEFIDFVGSWGPMILGHAHTEVVRKLEETLLKGTSFGAPTEGEILLAEMCPVLKCCVWLIPVLKPLWQFLGLPVDIQAEIK